MPPLAWRILWDRICSPDLSGIIDFVYNHAGIVVDEIGARNERTTEAVQATILASFINLFHSPSTGY
jgi:hypothetical protein